MSLQTELQNLATRAGTENKALRTLINGNLVDLSTLTTTTKASLLAAINELKASIDSLEGGGAAINDAATSTTTVWSSDKTNSEIGAAIANVIGAAPGTLDTLFEIAEALNNDADLAGTLTASIAATQAEVDALEAAVGSTAPGLVTTFEAALV